MKFLNAPRLAMAAMAASLAVSAPAYAGDGTAVPTTLPAAPADMGQVIFWRPGTMVGGAMGCGVNQGTERISALGAGKYFIVNLTPGTHSFNARSEARDELTLEVEPGETYYVRCTIRMGIMVGRPNLAPSTAEEFNTRRENLKYVDSDDVGPRVLPDPGATAAAAPAAAAG
jgi:hypothetical protein